MEPWGYYGGLQNKETVKNSYGIGFAAGWLVVTTVSLVFKLIVFVIGVSAAGIAHLATSFYEGLTSRSFD